ncbi:4-(cytidine 5'-diphospho)-2-C-methyl-D-erythritol kinase [Kordiimonas aestuarii]|uniref:4-(cytidine 5'-diphospho)-2-C-methyl-D-erythritol kinase n=1 Tax=Kordiimonas aestuarii TaxID=1005925 RepID=UPI0021CF0D2D|nr:4-(cytidine 5'-diphospho)-2-C-methyl-D-erythritol kinase [Kordiimonas aestuarii]
MKRRQEGQSVRVTAPAKVNLFLHITGRRDDGLHLLESLFVFTNNGDTITVTHGESLSFSLVGPFSGALDAGGDNLVMKAAAALAHAAGIKAKATITLEKNLPVAAGIGGGSADAAATLLALNRFWRLDWPLEKLAPIALSLGADVPACLYNKPLYVQGVGEKLTPVDLGFTAGMLLVNPNRELSTPAVFNAFRDAATPFDAPMAGGSKPWQTVEGLQNDTQNSLQQPAISACPDIQGVLDYLIAIPGVKLARMSGSGATCLALFDNKAEAEAAKTRGEKTKPEWWFMADEMTS